MTGRESENEEKMENYSKGSLLKLNFTLIKNMSSCELFVIKAMS